MRHIAPTTGSRVQCCVQGVPPHQPCAYHLRVMSVGRGQHEVHASVRTFVASITTVDWCTSDALSAGVTRFTIRRDAATSDASCRKGVNAEVHKSPHRAKFSEKLLPGTWVERHMKEAEEKMGVLDERPDDVPAMHAQRQRTMPPSWRRDPQSPDGAASTGYDGATDMDAEGAAAEHAQHAGRLPDLPLYHTGAGNSSGSLQQSRLPYQTDTDGAAHRQQSRQGPRQHRDGAGLLSHVGKHTHV